MAKRLTDGLDVDKLNQEVKDLGVRVRIWHSTRCPGDMKSLESVDHNINCTACNNNMIDFGCYESTAMVQQQTLVEKFKIQGTFDMDEVIMTFLSDVTLHIFSKIQVLDFLEDFFELVQKQPTPMSGPSIDKLKYQACEVLGLFVVANSVRTEYYFGADFALDPNGNIQWLTSRKPVDGSIYTIYYRHHPVFRAVRALHRNRYTQFNLRPDNIESQPKITVADRTYVKLPETWILKRDYLLERRDAQGNLIPDSSFPDPNA